MIEIIPAIDIIQGKCVRLEKGDYKKVTVYSKNPEEVAMAFEDAGIQRIHVVDLEGAKEKHVVNYKTLEKIASKTSLIIDFGGGIKSDDDIKIVYESGAKMATIGSVAVTDKQLFESWMKKYGPEKLILGADVKDNKIAITGWKNITEINLEEFLNTYLETGIKYVLCTDISRDGMLKGASIDFYKNISEKYKSLKFIASGGITSVDEIEELDKANIFGVIIGKAYYEGYIKFKDLQKFL